MARRKKSDDPHQQAMQECRKIVAETLAIVEVADSIEKPQIPEVLVNPDFLVVPRLGSLVTIDIQSLPEDRKLWDFTLAKIEDLFEIKMSAGAQTVVSLILFQWDEYGSHEDAISLLRRMFDRVLIIPVNENLRQIVTRFIRETIANPIARENLNYLWQLEKDARESNYERITNLSFVQNVLNAHIEFEKKPPWKERKPTQRELLPVGYVPSLTEGLIYERLLEEPQFWLQDRPRVMNMKQYLLQSLTQYYFTFDFAFSPSQSRNRFLEYFGQDDLDGLFESGGGLIKVITGSKGSFGRIATLRRVATYARFISYVPSEFRQELQPRTVSPRLFLLMEGKIFGPSYAPDRYINMLIHAGWRPINTDDFSKEALLDGNHA